MTLMHNVVVILGGLLPGLHLYLATFYPPRKLQVRYESCVVGVTFIDLELARSIAILHAALAAASAFSGLLCAAIIHMDGVAHKPGWAWLFILVGLASRCRCKFHADLRRRWVSLSS